MQRPCEVCTGLTKIGSPLPDSTRNKTRRVLVGDRIVMLCDAHTKELRERAVNDVSDLVTAFREPGGRRALVGRRSPLDRRVFPARPEGRRCSAGRRHDDVLD